MYKKEIWIYFFKAQKNVLPETRKERETDGREKEDFGTGDGTEGWDPEAGTHMGSAFFLQTGQTY